MNLLEINHIYKTYGNSDAAIHAPRNVSFSVPRGEHVAIAGEPESGKSTLLNVIGTLDTPTSGKVMIYGSDILSMSDHKCTMFRRRDVGLIFQAFNLISELVVEQNIIFPALPDYQKLDRQCLEKLFTVFNPKECCNRLPSQLFGGQQQRAAIKRAPIIRLTLILADEPIRSLDTQNSSEVIALLREASERCEQTVVTITHSRSISQTADRILQVSDRVLADFGKCRQRKAIQVLSLPPQRPENGKIA